MTSRKQSRRPNKGKQRAGRAPAGVPRSGSVQDILSGAPGGAPGQKPKHYKYTYTTGPFSLPLITHSIDWGILNNDPSAQKVRVTVFKCPLGAVKTAEPPGPLEVTLDPGETTHNANGATGGFFYEIQVECDSQHVFPYASAWAGAIANPIAGSVVKSAEFIRSLT